MKRQDYYPARQAEEPEWLNNFGDQATAALAATNIDAAIVTERVKDAKYCAWAIGFWLTEMRNHSQAATAAITQLCFGASDSPYTMPVLAAPALPAGVVAVKAGALDRIFRFVQDIKNAEGYSDTIGQTLRIIGAAESTPPDLPDFTLKLEMGTGCHCVRINFRKYGRMGVVVESRRGPAGTWEMLGIDTASPYLDERALLNPAQPEIREYRLRFWDQGNPTGDYTPVQNVTVSPS